MALFTKTSIKRKQTLIIMLSTGVALLLACAAFILSEMVTFRATMVQTLSTQAEIVGNNSSAALDFSDPKSATETLSALKAEPNIVGACIYTNQGRLFAIYDRANDGVAFLPTIHQNNETRFGNNSIELFRPITRDGEILGTVCVVSDLNELYARLERYVLIAAAVFFASGLVAFLLSVRLQQMISGPILHLVSAARAVTVEKNYSVRAIKESDDELGVLIDAFNEMLKQIQQRDAVLQESQIKLEKRVEERTEELRNSLSLIQATLESTTDGILATDMHGGVTGFNEKFIEMWRIQRETVDEKDYQRKIAAVSLLVKDPDKFLSRIEELYENPDQESFDLLELNDGRVLERYSKPQWVEKKCVGRVWSFRDVTERKRSEEQLERLGREYSAVLNSLGEGIHWLDRNGQIKFENPVAAKMLGYEVSELIGKPAHATMHHTRADGTPYPVGECPIYATLKDRSVRHVKDEVFCRKDGTSFPVEYTCAPIHDENGNFAGTVVIFTDVTESKRAEEELEQMHKQLLNASRQAGMAEVAASVLHNVGNVLNSVNVSSALISNQMRKSKVANLSKVVAMLNEHAADLGEFLTRDPKGSQLPAYLAQLAEHLAGEQTTILKELQLLHDNIDHIKDIVVMQQGHAKTSGVVEAVKITDLIEDSLRMQLGAVQQHGIEVRREFEVAPVMNVEKHKILQILVNLVRNAHHACDKSLRNDKLITLRVTRNNDHVQIAVIDNGIGISSENLVRIFNHGFTTRKDGHGFGLHGSALMAMELGGTLRVHSDGPGHGATFTLELPYKPHPGN